ncbi:MAG: PVC-type heme-binding CxxCH protein [Chthoniobacteraceae bacterium]
MKSLLFPASLLLAISVTLSPAETPRGRGPLSPEEELKTIKVTDGLRIELVASEPMVESPCAMAFDEKGRMFVTENRGYPSTSEPAMGRVVMLESTKGDGRYDKRTVFAEGLTFPNGVMPWDGGLIVTCAPDIFLMKDTDGDGRADEKRVLLTGFDFAKSTQLRVNCPTLGPDGWIYFAAGLSAGNITSPAHPEKPAVKMTGDLRWNPKTGDFETVDGKSQYGLAFDDYGRRFICMNRLPVQHVVLESRWLRRSPHLSFGETVQDCNERTVRTGLKGGGDGVRLFPISANITTADSHAGSFSAACGVRIWRGGALPGKFDGCALSCDPTGNLIHADRLVPHGATFAAVPLLEKHEMFASSDDWCRPVFLTRGPDGALYVCDMYRSTIEHPDYLPEEIRKHTDFEAGKKNGRIWRITSAKPLEKDLARAWSYAKDRGLEREDLDKAPLDELLRGAESSDARVRFRAALGLGDSRDERALPALARIAALGADDRWTRAAVLSGATGRERELASLVIPKLDAKTHGVFELLGEMGMTLGRATVAAKRNVMAEVSLTGAEKLPVELRIALLAGVIDGANVRIAPGDAEWIRSTAAAASDIAVKKDAPQESRLLAVSLLRRAGWSDASKPLTALATASASELAADLRAAAIRALVTFDNAAVADALLAPKRLAALTPGEREITLSALLSRPAYVARVLDAVEAGAVPRNAISAAQRTALSKSKDAALRDRAAKLFGTPADGDRMKAYEAAKAVLALAPNASHGREVFKTLCASCHRLNQEGYNVGPDLLGMRNQPKESILLHIVVPDFEVIAAFAASNVELKDGRILAGIIISDTPESITLRQTLGVEENIPRANIASLTAGEHSLMPPGLEATMKPQDLADLLSFLKGEQ